MRRRDILKAAPALLAAPAAMAAPAPEITKEELIRYHAETLLALIRADFPEDLTTLSVQVFSNWGPIENQRVRSKVTAQGAKTVRITDERTGRGFYTAQDAGHWSPDRAIRGLGSVRVVAIGD